MMDFSDILSVSLSHGIAVSMRKAAFAEFLAFLLIFSLQNSRMVNLAVGVFMVLGGLGQFFPHIEMYESLGPIHQLIRFVRL